MILKVLKWDRICQLLAPVVWDSRGPGLLLTEKERLCVAMRAHKSPEAQDKGLPSSRDRVKLISKVFHNKIPRSTIELCYSMQLELKNVP